MSILEALKFVWVMIIELVISIGKSINIIELIILFGMCWFIPWMSDKRQELKRKKLEKRNKVKNLEKDNQTTIREFSSTQDLEQNTKLWWNFEGWKNEEGWICPDPIISSKEKKIYKIKEDRWI